MANLNQKNTFKALVQSRYTQAVLLVAALFIFTSAINRYSIAADMAEKRLLVEQEIYELEERKESLSAEVRYLQHERGIEAEMRKQFDIARAGEQVVIILEDEVEATTTDSADTQEVDEDAPWYRFWQ